MKLILPLFLQIVIVFIGLAALTFVLWEPTIEGRNVHASLVEIYFQDPFMFYAYIASIPFFCILNQAFKALGYGKRKSLEVMKALRNIRYCALVMIMFVVGGEIFIMFSPSDDRAGGVFMGLLITVCAIIIAVTTVWFERSLSRV